MCVSLFKRVDRCMCVHLSALRYMRHMCCTNDPHVCVGFSQARLMHGSCGAECSGPHWLNCPGTISECGPQFALSEGMVHLLSTAFRYIWGTEEKCARPTPCRQNQVLSVWLGTPTSISPVHFFLPRLKSAQTNTSALTTCRQDKQSRLPKFCHVWKK